MHDRVRGGRFKERSFIPESVEAFPFLAYCASARAIAQGRPL